MAGRIGTGRGCSCPRISGGSRHPVTHHDERCGVGYRWHCGTYSARWRALFCRVRGIMGGRCRWPGGCTLLLAVIFCAVPCGPLTAVGLVTAYFAIVGVIQLIGGLSVRWATERIGVT